MQFQLNFVLDSASVTQIHGNAQNVTIVKNVVSEPLATGNLQVAWLTFSPFTSNQVSWTQSYYMYAMQAQPEAGATIMRTSTTDAPVQLGPLYEFSGNVFTTGAQGSPKTYNVLNSNGQSLTFGLAQQATINGISVISPLNATRFGNAQKGSFTPIETVSIYLSSFTNNGVVITQVAGSALVVQLTSQLPVATVGFNKATNSFFLLNQGEQEVSFTDVALDRLPELTGTPQRQLR